MKKTIKLIDLINEVNRRNKESTCKPEVREGWNSLLESILHTSECYEGYTYLYRHEVPIGQLPGIRGIALDKEYPDVTRRSYRVSYKLKAKE